MNLPRFGLTVRGLTWASLFKLFFPSILLLLTTTMSHPPNPTPSSLTVLFHASCTTSDPQIMFSVWENMRPFGESSCLLQQVAGFICVGLSRSIPFFKKKKNKKGILLALDPVFSSESRRTGPQWVSDSKGGLRNVDDSEIWLGEDLAGCLKRRPPSSQPPSSSPLSSR